MKRIGITTVVAAACLPTSTAATAEGAARAPAGVDGVLLPGGFGVRGIEGKIGAAQHAREHGVPTLGLCLGLQCMVIEAARHLAGLAQAHSAEFDPATPDPVIATMADQRDVIAGDRDMGGTMRRAAVARAEEVLAPVDAELGAQSIHPGGCESGA